MRATVETALGPTPADELGPTLMHEHILCLDHELEVNYPGRSEEATREQDAVRKLTEVARRGVKTIVDLTVIGLGRDVRRIRKIATQVDLNIVVATGLYTYDEVPFAYRLLRGAADLDSPDLLVELFVGDLTQGIADTGVKAAILKCATDKPGVTPGVERVLRAVARAHHATGAPITTHTDAATQRGLDQQAIFRQEGVDLEHVVIGHCGDTTDLDYLQRLLDAGSFIGMDRFGLDHLLPFDERVGTVATLCALGYTEQIVLSHDTVCFTCNFEIRRKSEVNPRSSFTHLHDDVLPTLTDLGVTEMQIEQMLVENPRKVLASD